jgi:hypothetical protein
VSAEPVDQQTPPRVQWRGGPLLDHSTEEDYRREQADYTD